MSEQTLASSKTVEQEYYEMYYDPENRAPYFYNPKTGATVWELPKGSI